MCVPGFGVILCDSAQSVSQDLQLYSTLNHLFCTPVSHSLHMLLAHQINTRSHTNFSCIYSSGWQQACMLF